MRPSVACDPRLLSVLFAVLIASAAVPLVGPANAAEHNPPDPQTTIHISIQSNGDARLTVTMRFALQTDNDTAAFERLAREFENGTTTVLSSDPFERAANGSSNVTGRPMAITGVERNGSHDTDVGRLKLSFTWSGFVRTDGDRLLLGDVFQTPSGTWLPELSSTQELVFTYPEAFSPENLEWPLRNGSVVIEGPAEFEPGEPAATFEWTGIPSPTATPTITRTRTATILSPGTPTNRTGLGYDLVPGPIFGVLAALLLLGGLAYLAYRSDEDLPWDGSPGTTDDASGLSTEEAETADTEPDADSVAATGEPLLSDEERILNLLEEHDGRMKQTVIVEETDWSNAKVSQLLSELDEADSIEKLRIGRENLITLPDRVPDGVE